MSLRQLLTSPLTRQIWVVTAICFMMVGNGMLMGVTNCMVPALQAPDSDIQVDLEAGSWLNASVGLSSMLMYLGSSLLMASYGRRLATIFGLVPAVVSPVICYLAKDLKTLLIGRFLGGVGLGSVVGSVVVVEYTAPKYRGVFFNLKVWMIVVGFTLVHILGNYFHWRTVMLTLLVPYILNIFMAYTWPESPAWLATQKRYDECAEAFYWLRGESDKSTRELNAMMKAQRKLNNDSDKRFTQKVRSFFLKFKQTNFLKPLGLSCLTAMLLETGGRHVFPAYAMQIIQQMDNNKSHSFFYTMCIDVIINVSIFVSTVLVKIMKRRSLLICSGTASVLVLLAVSLYYYLQSKSLLSEDWSALSFVLFGSYFAFINAGCAPVSFTLLGELFPLEHRSIGSAMAGFFISIFMFITLKITPFMLVTIEVYGTFSVYGLTMGLCLLVLYLTLPETKDKTMQEIEDYFNDQPYICKDLEDDKELKNGDKDVELKLLP